MTDDIAAPATAALPFSGQADPDGRVPPALPPALRQALETVREYGCTQWLDTQNAGLALQHETAGGFRPVPPPVPPRQLGDDAVVAATAPVVTVPVVTAGVVTVPVMAADSASACLFARTAMWRRRARTRASWHGCSARCAAAAPSWSATC